MVVCHMLQQFVFAMKPETQMFSIIILTIHECLRLQMSAGYFGQKPKIWCKIWLSRALAPLDRAEEILGLIVLCLVVSVDVILPLEASPATRFGAVVTTFWLISA